MLGRGSQKHLPRRTRDKVYHCASTTANLCFNLRCRETHKHTSLGGRGVRCGIVFQTQRLCANLAIRWGRARKYTFFGGSKTRSIIVLRPPQIHFSLRCRATHKHTCPGGHGIRCIPVFQTPHFFANPAIR